VGAILVAVGTKLVGVLLLPWLFFRSLRWGFLALALSGLSLVPMLLHAGDAQAGVNHYARRWAGNGAPFSLLAAGIEQGLYALSTPEERASDVIEADVFARLAATPFDPLKSVLGPKKSAGDRRVLSTPFAAAYFARALVALVVLAVALHTARIKDPRTAARITLFTALALAPQVHPWYLLWLLPVEAMIGGQAALVWSVTILVAYAPLDLWQQARIWNEWRLATWCEFGVVALVLAHEARLNRQTPREASRLSPLPHRDHAA
jgi:hypothetical protein